MKRILLVFSLIVGGAVYGWSASGNLWSPCGFWYNAQTPGEFVVTVSSTAVVTSSAVVTGVYREFMNTGTGNILRFVNISSSNTANLSYIPPGAVWVEDRYQDNYYFIAAPGSSSTLSIKTFANQ